MGRATETLSPIYDERMQKTLEGVDKELIARGFFGQLPGAALAGARAADVERAKAAAIASLGAQMQSQSEEQALAQQRLAAEWAMNQTSLWNQLQQQRLQGLGNLFNLSLYYPLHYADVTGTFLGGAPTAKSRAALAAGGVQQAGSAGAAPQLTLATNPLTQLARSGGDTGYGYSLPGSLPTPIVRPLRMQTYYNPWG